MVKNRKTRVATSPTKYGRGPRYWAGEGPGPCILSADEPEDGRPSSLLSNPDSHASATNYDVVRTFCAASQSLIGLIGLSGVVRRTGSRSLVASFPGPAAQVL